MPRTTIVIQTTQEPSLRAIERSMDDVAKRLRVMSSNKTRVLSWVAVLPQADGESGSTIMEGTADD